MNFAHQHKTRARFRLILNTADWPCYRCDNHFSGNRSKRSWTLITGRRNGAQNLSKGGHGKGVRLLSGDNWDQIRASMGWFLGTVPFGKQAKKFWMDFAVHCANKPSKVTSTKHKTIKTNQRISNSESWGSDFDVWCNLIFDLFNQFIMETITLHWHSLFYILGLSV